MRPPLIRRQALLAFVLAMGVPAAAPASSAIADTIIVGRPYFGPPAMLVRPAPVVVVRPYRPVYVAPRPFVAYRAPYGGAYRVTRYHGPRCSAVVVRGPYRRGGAVRC